MKNNRGLTNFQVCVIVVIGIVLVASTPAMLSILKVRKERKEAKVNNAKIEAESASLASSVIKSKAGVPEATERAEVAQQAEPQQEYKELPKEIIKDADALLKEAEEYMKVAGRNYYRSQAVDIVSLQDMTFSALMAIYCQNEVMIELLKKKEE